MSDTTPTNTSRRDFLKVGALATGALAVGVSFTGCASPQQRFMEQAALDTGAFAPNAYITISPDNAIYFTLNAGEMGQGVMTSHAMMVAEELEVDLDAIVIQHAGADSRFGALQVTGGSNSVRRAYVPLRKAAAAAREMLVATAAARWGVPASELTVTAGVVSHTSGKTATYGELATDAAKQPIPSDPKIKSPSEFKILGKKTDRVDAVAKSTGTAVFGLDVEVPNMVRAWILHPPSTGGRAVSIDADEAKSMTGVIDVFVFERGVAVVAEKTWQARRAAQKVSVTWEKANLEGFDSDAMMSAMAARATSPGDVVRSEGDPKRVFERDDVDVIEAVYDSPYLAHATMEPQNAVAHYKGDSVEIWSPTQSPSVVRSAAMDLTGLPEDKVIAHTTLMGGGFGRRAGLDFAAEAILVSMRVERPVQVVWSREEDMRNDFYRPQTLARMRAAVTKEGEFVGFHAHLLGQSIIASSNWIGAAFPKWIPEITRTMLSRTTQGLFNTGTVVDPTSTEGFNDLPYDVETQLIEYSQVNVGVPVGAWRSVGHSQNAFYMEAFIDEIAHAAGKDPVAFRLDHLSKHPRQRRVLEEAAKRSGWGQKLPEGTGRGVAQHASFESFCAQVVDLRVVDGRIHVDRVVCVIDCGLALNPDIVKAQMEGGIVFALGAALHQKISLVDGVVVESNFDDHPLLRMHEAPEIEVYIIDSDEDPTGVGEPGVPPLAPAVANAIFDATGTRVRSAPMQPALLAALERNGGSR